jgi:uncharacterized OsmC-like protein
MHKKINGIRVKELHEMVNLFKENPALARFQFRIKNTWMNKGHSRSIVKGFYGFEKEDDTRTFPFIFEVDQPINMLGNNLGPIPIEYALNGLISCLANSIVYNAAAKGINIEDVESELEGIFDLRCLFGVEDGSEKIAEGIRVKFRIKGNNLSDEQRKFLCDLGKKSSPVFKIIANPFPVTVSLENELYEE